MKGALVAKPGFVLSQEAHERLFRILESLEVVFVSEDMGGEYFLSEASRPGRISKFISIGHITERNYALRFDEFIVKVAAKGVDVVITVGGDGIASYMATAIIRQQKKLSKHIGILGFPAGTANVGPIVQANQNEKSLLKKKGLDAIEVSCAGKVLGYGFNDVIIGRTFLGTIDGKWANLNARAMAEKGEAVQYCLQDCMQEESVVDLNFKIFLNGKEVYGLQPRFPHGLPHKLPHELPPGNPLGLPQELIKQICISTLHQENLYGRAIIGGLVEAYGFRHPAAIALLDKISNDARPETWGIKGFRTTTQLCFDEGDVIKLAGFAKDVCVIIDGNPFVIEKDSVVLRCVPEAVLVYGNWR